MAFFDFVSKSYWNYDILGLTYATLFQLLRFQ